MGEWITVADALKAYKITKPTLYKYIGLGKIHTELVRNKLFIDRSGLKEYIANRRKYGGKPVDNYMKGLFEEQVNGAKGADGGVEKTETISDENNSQNRLATVALGGLGKMSNDTIEHYRLMIKEKDISLENKNKTITILGSIVGLLIGFIALLSLFIYLFIPGVLFKR